MTCSADQALSEPTRTSLGGAPGYIRSPPLMESSAPVM
jgi:hypothetical protein